MVRRISVFALGAATLLTADSLQLRSGNTIQGMYVGGDSRVIRFATGNQINSYNVGDVTGIQFSSVDHSQTSAPPAPYPSQAYPPAYGPSSSGENSAANPSPAPPPNPYSAPARPPIGYAGTAYPPPNAAAPNSNPAGIELAAGTPITVRLIDPVNSETDRLGQTYRATVDEPVVLNGQEIVPRGSDVVVSLVGAQQSGKIEGRTVMTLALRNLTVNGTPYNVTSSGVVQASESRGSRSAKVVGGTAALGAIIGGLAGGGRGAAIGAVSGGAVGAAAEVATSGQKVKVPSETRLTFTLQNPLDL